LRVPVAAEVVMLTFAVIEVELTNVVELTVIPVPEKATVAPLAKPLPVIVMAWLVAPWPRLLGLVAVTVGPVLTVNMLVPVPTPASELMTVRLRAPVAADGAMLMFPVSEVALLNVTELTVMPVPENVTFAPLTKPVPLMVMFWFDAPWPRPLGLVELTVGPALTVKPFVLVPTPASPFVSVTSRVPTVAVAETVMLAVSCVELTKVVELTVIPFPNEEASEAPLTKPLPPIVMLWLVAPWPRLLGLVELTVGAALTVKMPVAVPAPLSGFVTVTFRAPVVAPEDTLMFAVSEVALLNVTELTVMQVPENVTFAPLTKPVPLMVMLWFDAPWPRESGAALVTVTGEVTDTVFGALVAVHDLQTAVTV
jgi:hypothetical protein